MACGTNRQSAIPWLGKLDRWIVAGLALELPFCIVIINVPAFRHCFTAAPFGIEIWMLMLLAPVIIFVVEELRKLLVRRGVKILET